MSISNFYQSLKLFSETESRAPPRRSSQLKGPTSDESDEYRDPTTDLYDNQDSDYEDHRNNV